MIYIPYNYGSMKEGIVINCNLITSVLIYDYNLLIVDNDCLRNRKRIACVCGVILGRFISKTETPKTA